MAQHDYIIANQSGAAFRSDLNNGLAAIVSQNSGAAEPSTTYAYQWWADTTTGLLKIRNAANNAWITVGTLASANLGLLSLAGGTLTGALLVDDSGTAALPAIAFDGDPNTGIYRPGADQLGIATNGVERVEFGTTEVVFNDGGGDFDFRIEGDTKPNLFKIDASLDQVQVENLNGGPLAGFRNVIINGNPTINQRGYVSGAATTVVNQYTLDRWRVVTSGQNISWTDSANVRTVTAPAGGCEQVVEGLSILSGTYTLNWTGTATATVGGSAVAKGGNVTLTGGTNATVKFSSGTFSLVQLEPGPVATPFEQRPVGTELALCQRYFQFFGSGVSGQEETATTFSLTGRFFVPMRAAPTAVMPGTTFSTRIASSGDRTLTGVSINASSISNEAAWFVLNNSGGGNVSERFFQERAASSYILLSAEL
jgi:hypothetical protein